MDNVISMVDWIEKKMKENKVDNKLAIHYYQLITYENEVLNGKPPTVSTSPDSSNSEPNTVFDTLFDFGLGF